MSADLIPVRYVYPRQGKGNGLYDGGLTFEVGQVRNVPAHLAKSLLRHRDLFQRADSPAKEPEPAIEIDDTAAQIEDAMKKKAAKDSALHDKLDLLDQIERMETKEELSTYAMVNWQHRIDQRLSVESMRNRVKGLVEQFGFGETA
jgi:hypothetical protein